jgi:Leucine Rich repeat
MPTEPSKSDMPKRKRRWFQFSLRTLLIFTLICAVACAWLARRVDQKRKELQAVDALVELGGRVDYGSGFGDASGPAWLRQLLGDNFFNDVFYVDLKGTNVTDSGLENLRELTQLGALRLMGSNFTDDGLANLKGLTQLKVLNLTGTGISDAGLKNLVGLSHLIALRLDGTNVTDAGVNELQRALPNCKLFR